MAVVISGNGIDMGGNPVSNASQIEVQENQVSPFSGFKNYIINGNFDIWQRGTTTVSVQNAANIYHTDRFKTTCGLTTGRLDVSKSSLSYNNDSYSSVKVTSSIATVTSGDADRYFGIGQNIEANSCYNLSGKQITISFLFNTNTPGAFYYSLVCTSGVDSSPRYSLVGAFTALSGSQKITLNIPQLPNEAIIAGTNSGFNLAIGNVPGSNSASTTTTLSNWLSEGKTYYTNARNWAGTVGNYIEIAQVQLEAGSVATPFENRPYGLELSLCQRYYEAGRFIQQLGIGTTIGVVLTGQAFFKTPKRVVPTVTYLDSSGAQNKVTLLNNSGTETNGVSVIAGNQTNNDMRLTANTTNTTQNGIAFTYTASAEL